MTTRLFVVFCLFYGFFTGSAYGQRSKLDSLINVTNTFSKDTLAVLAYADLCYEYRFIHQDSALLFGKAGVELGEKLKFKNGLAQAYSDLAFVYFDKSDFKNAIDYWTSALTIRKQLKDQPRVASLYMKLGGAQFQQGDYEQSLQNQLQALRIYEELNLSLGIGHALNNVAAVYEQQNQLDKANEYYMKAYGLYEKDNNTLSMAASLINVGNVRFLKKDYQDAKSIYLKAANLFEAKDQSSKHNLSICFNNISEIYTHSNQYDSALFYSRKALDLRTEISDFQGVVSSMNMLGRIHTKLRKYGEAERYLLAALDSAVKKNLLPMQGKINQNLFELYEAKGDLKEALSYYIRFASVKDSMLNESGKKQIAEMQVVYETEKKQQQLALQDAELSEKQSQIERNYFIIAGLGLAVTLLGIIFFLLRNRQQKRQEIIDKEHEISLREAFIEASIQSQENERKRFAQDLHDGMGQWISSLRLALADINLATSDEKKLQVVERSEKIMEEMNREFRSIAFNLMPHTLIQYGLKPALDEMAMRLNQIGTTRINVSSYNFPERLTELQEISLYRILQEWTNNIIKYAKASKIEIQLIGHEDEMNIMVEDDGHGFDIRSLETNKGNGWKNILSRLNLIKGNPEVDSMAGRKGTTFTITVPFVKEVASTPLSTAAIQNMN